MAVLKYRDVLDEVQPHAAAIIAAAAAVLGAGASIYSTQRQAASAKKARALASRPDMSSGGIGGYTPSALSIAGKDSTGGIDGQRASEFFKGMEKPADQQQPTLGDASKLFSQDTAAPEPGFSLGNLGNTQLGNTNPNPQQTPPPETTEVPYGQYANLASTAAQVAQMFTPKPAQPSPIAQATMGPYSATAGMFRRKPTGGF